MVRYRFIDEHKGAYPVQVLCRAMRGPTSAYHTFASGKSYVLSAAKTVLAKARRRCPLRSSPPLRLTPHPRGDEGARDQDRAFRSAFTDAAAEFTSDLSAAVHAAHGKWSYLASWQDKFTKRIVGWAIADRMTDELVTSALGKAIRSCSVRSGTIVHTDQGSQFVSHNFRRLLTEIGCWQSMSRRGNCYDNATAESFFSRFKAELLEGGMFADVAQARSETFSYMEGYYNRVRRHSSLGYQSPVEFERELGITKKGSGSERVVSCET